ncbi:11245_t:CDS:2 [Paraglomus brasilianum]|uniref:11245_t:CDS:1 n=1 Tax=Paraglomus brasilianum TaxID=144538 RepID=A0A9N9D9R0_9GLOM|nr:11245_t:CDS:2 [Paraglomus brasilianum]
MSTVLVQGASRGIGQALVRTLLLRTPYDVIATCRDPETSQSQITSTLDSSLLRRLFVYKLDVTRESTIVNCSEQVKKNHGEKPLRLLINSAGILHVEESLDQINVDLMAENFQTNATGNLLVCKHFVKLLDMDLEAHREEQNEAGDSMDLLPKFAIVANISVKTSSITDGLLGGWYSYRTSKAALNQLTRTLSIEFTHRKQNVISVALYPGIVDTDLSRQYLKKKPSDNVFTPDQSAGYLVNVIKNLKLDDSGYLLTWDGKKTTF